jgi:hypothetical protein
MPKKKKLPKSETQSGLLIIDWKLYDHPDLEERRAYRLWLVLYHEASWGRNVSASDLCRRLECSLPQLGAALNRLKDHRVISTVGSTPPGFGCPHGLN